jgi:hypothetical protein
MPDTGFPFAIVQRAASTGSRLGAALVGRALHHPFEIDRLDASAGSLWPRNPEEAVPPRWQFDHLEPQVRRPEHRADEVGRSSTTGPLRVVHKGASCR